MEGWNERLSQIRAGWDTLKTKKDKLKKTAYMCSQELKKARRRVRELEREVKEEARRAQQAEKEKVALEDRAALQEEKLEYYKKQVSIQSFCKYTFTINIYFSELLGCNAFF